MGSRKVTAPALIVLLVVTGLLYFHRLDDSPVYLAHDEVMYAIQAQSIASSGRDINGRLLPLYFSEQGYEAGRDPIGIYATAALLRVMPLSETAIRLPGVLVGMLDVVLMFLVARRLFASDAYGLCAAALLALSPSHFGHSREATAALYPVPFVLVWALAFSMFVERPSWPPLLAAASALGVGLFSYLAAVVQMPLLFIYTAWTAVQRRGPRWLPALAAGFGVPVMLLLAWQLTHPGRYGDIVQSYRIYDNRMMNPLQGARDLVSYFSLGVRADTYWNFFNPSFLFISGPPDIRGAARVAGVFPISLIVLLPLGAYHVFMTRTTAVPRGILLGFLTAPIAALFVAQVSIHRALVILPFGVLLATYGVERLMTSGRALFRAGAVALVLVVPVSFGAYYADYFASYRIRSAAALEGNIRGGVEELLSRADTAHRVYISDKIPYADGYWRFYAIASHRNALVDAVTLFDPARADINRFGPGSLVMSRVGEVSGKLRDAGRTPVRVTPIAEPGGLPMFEVVETGG